MQVKPNQPKIKPKEDLNFDAEMKNIVVSGGDDEIELEDKYHDTDIMECVSVIEHEI